MTSILFRINQILITVVCFWPVTSVFVLQFPEGLLETPHTMMISAKCFANLKLFGNTFVGIKYYFLSVKL